MSTAVRPGDALQVFAFADDYSFGILQSSAHWQWFVAKCSKLKSDFRYTPESVFDTFPWPQAPTEKQIDAIAAAGYEIRCIRTEVLLTMHGGLCALYRTLDLPGRNPLRDAHAKLDAAVLAAYGFSAKGHLLQQLLDLNRTVAEKVGAGDTATGSTFGFLGATVIWFSFLFFLLITAAFGGLQSFSVPVLGAALVGAAVFAAVLASGLPSAWSVIPLMVGVGVGLAGPSRDLLVRRVATESLAGGNESPAFGHVHGFVYSGLDVGLALGPLAFGMLLDAGRRDGVLPGVALLQILAVFTVLATGRRVGPRAITPG